MLFARTWVQTAAAVSHSPSSFLSLSLSLSPPPVHLHQLAPAPLSDAARRVGLDADGRRGGRNPDCGTPRSAKAASDEASERSVRTFGERAVLHSVGHHQESLRIRGPARGGADCGLVHMLRPIRLVSLRTTVSKPASGSARGNPSTLRFTSAPFFFFFLASPSAQYTSSRAEDTGSGHGLVCPRLGTLLRSSLWTETPAAPAEPASQPTGLPSSPILRNCRRIGLGGASLLPLPFGALPCRSDPQVRCRHTPM